MHCRWECKWVQPLWISFSQTLFFTPLAKWSPIPFLKKCSPSVGFLHWIYIIFIHFILGNLREKGYAYPLSQKSNADQSLLLKTYQVTEPYSLICNLQIITPAGLASWVCNHTEVPFLEEPCGWFNALLIWSWNSNHFWTKNRHFHFALDPTTYVAGLAYPLFLSHKAWKTVL